MQNFLYSMVSGSGNILFHCILLFWIFTAFIFSFFITRLNKNDEKKTTAFPLGLMFFLHLLFCSSLFFIENPSSKLPPIENGLIAIDALLFILAWKSYFGEKKNVAQIVFIVLTLIILSFISVYIWHTSKLPFYSNITEPSGLNIQIIWLLIMGVCLLLTALSSFKKNMPVYPMIFASVVSGGLILHIALNEWINQTNYSPFLRIAMLFAYPILVSYPLVQLALINKQRTEAQEKEKKNKLYNEEIEIKENSVFEQKLMANTQPSVQGINILQTEPSTKIETFPITVFFDEFITEKQNEFKAKQVEINAFYQGLEFQVAHDRAEFKAAFESFFSFLEIICDKEYQVNIILGDVSNIEIVQVDIIASAEKIEELNDQLFIAGQRFEDLNIQNDYALESPTLLRMQLAI